MASVPVFDQLLSAAAQASQRGAWAEAGDCLSQAARLQPEAAPVLSGLGTCLLNLGRPAEALPHFQKVAQLAPQVAEAHNNLGVVYAHLGQTQPAEAAFRRALDCDQQHSTAWKNLAGLYLKHGRIPEGVAILERLRPAHPDDLDTLGLLAEGYEAGGDTAAAQRAYQHILALHPGQARAAAALARLTAPPAPDYSQIAQIVRHMAETGAGTDACLELGCLPMRVHFYSPVPDIKDLERRRIWERRSPLAGIDFRSAAQLTLLAELGRQFGHECAWPTAPTRQPHQFHLNNGSFSYGCAASLHTLLRQHRPRRVIEIGSGNSSLVISAALQMNGRAGAPADYTVIDPYPAPAVAAGLPGLTRLLPQPVETTDVELFDALEADDVLFIDSGHTVKTGGDVNFLILDILPRLKPGVLIHFHDIGLPYEYPKTYATNPGFRVFWTEAYLLQAFLACNHQFEILLALGYLMTEHLAEFRAAFPHFDPARSPANSGSFWIRRTA